MANKFDELLIRLGTGKWNYLYFISVSVWFFLIPPQSLSGTYIAPTIPYTCRPPRGVNTTISEDSCTYFVNTSSGSDEVMPCTDWDFDTSVFSSTLTSEFQLVCDRGYLRATYQSMMMFGSFFSPIIGGFLADRLGRRLVVIVTLSLFTVVSSCISFLSDFTAILAFRFVLGCVNLPTFYILAMEVCEPKMRSFVGVLTALPWAAGTMAWGGVAYLIRDWRTLQLVVSLPNLVIFPALYLMDESPRWLIIRGKHEQALATLKKAARWNGATLPPEDDLRRTMRDIEAETTSSTEKGEVKSKNGYLKSLVKFAFILCKTRKVTLITVIMFVDNLIGALVYYGISLSGTSFSANPFVYMALSGLVEVPSYSVTAPIIAKLGRKGPTCIGFLVCGVAILALAFIPSDVAWLVMTLAMTGKLFISSAYQIIYVYVTELFPTEVRTTGMGSAVLASRIGNVMAPFVTDFLGPWLPWAPSVIFGASSLVAAAVTLLLRETRGAPLPDTIADLETIGKRPESRDAADPGELVTLSH
ncbi:organic cation transporter protein-like isoform X2 [Penaeus japonicus]|uniref:organic cation transporter protein-like isoform X2 n=1 Tax=Penaeus japonicus TaxID=27405 RepID=UPI001C712BBF|nr:organic cation transporter protein-like isoform X2 [Penaeus japonicus]